jgi:mono/diheme cytochrome c family protein
MSVGGLLGLCLLAASCVPAARAPARPPTVPAQAEAARDVLVYHCGRCHRSDLPTAIPGALAVFDLTDDLWYRGLGAEQLESALRRLRSKDDLDPRDLATMEAFVASAK